MSYSPFDYVKAIRRAGAIPDDMSGYNQFIVNKALYASIPTITQVGIANRMKGLGNEMHFAFLYTAIKNAKYIPWAKAPKHEHLNDVMKYFQCSYEKALQYVHLLTEEDITEIVTMYKEQETSNV